MKDRETGSTDTVVRHRDSRHVPARRRVPREQRRRALLFLIETQLYTHELTKPTYESRKQPPSARALIHSIPWFFMISLTLMFFAFNLRASSASKLLTGAAWPFSPAAAEAEAEAGAAAAAAAAAGAAKVAVTATSAAGGAGAGAGSAAHSD